MNTLTIQLIFIVCLNSACQTFALYFFLPGEKIVKVLEGCFIWFYVLDKPCAGFHSLTTWKLLWTLRSQIQASCSADQTLFAWTRPLELEIKTLSLTSMGWKTCRGFIKIRYPALVLVLVAVPIELYICTKKDSDLKI